MQSDFHLVSILITPVGPLARVSVFRKREMVHFFPVSLNQLVQLDALPALVLHTALNADREVQSLLLVDDPIPSVALRLRQIKKIRTLAEQDQRKQQEKIQSKPEEHQQAQEQQQQQQPEQLLQQLSEL